MVSRFCKHTVAKREKALSLTLEAVDVIYIVVRKPSGLQCLSEGAALGVVWGDDGELLAKTVVLRYDVDDGVDLLGVLGM